MAENEKVAIVTGAARGIGREIVRELAAAGMTVVAVDLSENVKALPDWEITRTVKNAAGQEQSASERPLGECGDRLDCRVLDVTDSDAFTSLVSDVAERYGRLDVLVNNAGITRDGLLLRMSDADWNLVLTVNLTSAFIGTRAAARFMIRRKSGSIINMASYSGLEGNPGQANYSASKAGMIGLTKTTARELAGKNVRCNAVAPGFIRTEMTDILPQRAKDVALGLIPLKRFGLPSDVARAVGFLASDASGYITGQVLSVDGGMHT